MYSMCSMIVHQGEVAWRHQWLPTRTRERQNSASVRGRMLHNHVEDGYACDVGGGDAVPRRDARHYALRRVRGAVSSAVVTAQRAEAEFGSWMFGDMSF